MKAIGFWAAARNAALKVVAFWVLIFAAYLAIGRQFFPYVDHLKPEFETWLTYQLGTRVEIGDMRGEWERFNPVLHLQDVRLGEALTVSEITLAPGIFESISRGGLSFIRFELIDFSAQLVESPDGWTMTGLASNNASNTPIDLQFLLALLRRQEEVTFTKTQLEIEPLNLPAFSLTLEQGRLNGYEGENGLVANATLTANSIAIPIELQIETTANATGLNRVYFRHGEIDLAPWTKNIISQISASTVAGEYWLTLQGEQWQNLTARLSSPNFVFHGQYNDLVVGDANVEAYVENKGNGQETWLNVLGYTLNGQTFGSTQGKFSSRAGRVKVQWDSLPANLVGHWLALNDPNYFWENISPTGFLEQGYVTLKDADLDSVIAQATLTDFSMQAHQAVPGVDKLAGTIRVEGNAGRIELASERAAIQLANLYDSAFVSKVERASLTWVSEPNLGLFSQGLAELSLLPGPHQANPETLPLSVAWQTVSPVLAQRELGRESTVELQVAASRLSKSWAIDLSKNKLVNPSVGQLLDERLLAGEFSKVSLNYLAGYRLNQPALSQFFIRSQFDQVDFTFLDEWEAISSLNGQLSINENGIQIQGAKAEYPGFSLDQLRMSLDFDQYLMDVELSAQAKSSNALQFLQNGPLRSNYGDTFDRWRVNGNTALTAHIKVPLAAPEEFTARVDVNLDNNDLDLQQIDMQYSDVSGRISYDTSAGISSNGLTLRHLGLLQTVTLDSYLVQSDAALVIKAQGETPLQYWGERFDDAFLSGQRSLIAHDTMIEIFPTKVSISSKSNLQGVELPFPAPFAKSETQILPLTLSVDFDERAWTIVKATLDNTLVSFFELNQDNEIQRGTVAVNSDLNVRQENGVFFDISVNEVDADDWWQAIQELRKRYAQTPQDGKKTGFESLIKSIQITAMSLDYLAQPWSKLKANLLRNENAWIISFNAEEGQGQVLVPHEDEPIFAQMNWLSITTGEDDISFVDELDPLVSYLPSDIPNMQLQVSKLIWNKRDMGSWRAEVEIADNELHARNIVGEMNGATVVGSMRWALKNSKHKTTFKGVVTIGNILDVLETWGYAPVLTSRSGTVDVDAFWQGSPAFFDFKRLQGSIKLALRKGAILQVEEYEGIKLIGLLNFTRVIQRIALDFSDLVQTGITFDSVEGELLFDRGFARVGEKLVIDGSATKFKFSGDADLLSDELDIDMILTVPLSSTFPLVALLAGVSPQAAAAIYVTERVFNNELERLSSARMHITGSFEAPETKFYRVFETNVNEPATSEIE